MSHNWKSELSLSLTCFDCLSIDQFRGLCWMRKSFWTNNHLSRISHFSAIFDVTLRSQVRNQWHRTICTAQDQDDADRRFYQDSKFRLWGMQQIFFLLEWSSVVKLCFLFSVHWCSLSLSLVVSKEDQWIVESKQINLIRKKYCSRKCWS